MVIRGYGCEGRTVGEVRTPSGFPGQLLASRLCARRLYWSILRLTEGKGCRRGRATGPYARSALAVCLSLYHHYCSLLCNQRRRKLSAVQPCSTIKGYTRSQQLPTSATVRGRPSIVIETGLGWEFFCHPYPRTHHLGVRMASSGGLSFQWS